MFHRTMTTFGTAILQAAAPPAGGAALAEVVGASAGAAVLTAVLLLAGWAHRTRRTTVLSRAATSLGERTGAPGWVALPTLVSLLSLVTALIGMYWDISLHIADGRDEGPLANPAHYFILAGLFGLFASGVLAVALPLDERPGPAAVRITRGWHAPVGGLLVAGSGLYALLGFPLDDVWHRLFGQDVTLWGPTHLMLIGGAGMSLVGVVVLTQEGRLATAGTTPTPGQRRATLVRHALAMGGLLVGLSVFQGEFDFGVPQFRLVFQPFLIAAAAGLALVTARLWLGRGGAVAAVAAYLLLRGSVSLVVGPVLGEPMPSVPLYLGSAVLVELAGLLLHRRPLLLGVVGGLGVGTVGTLSELWWSRVAMPLPWGADVVAEGLVMGAAGGLAGGVLGGLLCLGLAGRLPRPAVTRSLFAAALVVLTAAVANGLAATVPTGVRAEVTLQEESAGEARVGVRFDPAGVVDADPAWMQVTSWQGGGLRVVPMEPAGPGQWRTTAAVPVDGAWKTMVRIHDGRTLAAVPLYLPADAAIGARAVPAQASATRDVVPEVTVLQRERKLDAPAWLWTASCLAVLACSLALVLALGSGVARLARCSSAPAPAAARAPEPVAAAR
jgi:hypothetical protein